MMDVKTMTAIIEDMGYKPIVRVTFKEQYGGEVEGIEIHVDDSNKVCPVIYPCAFDDMDEYEFRAFVHKVTSEVPEIDMSDIFDNILDKVRVGVVPSGNYPFAHKPSIYEGIDVMLYVQVLEHGTYKFTDDVIEKTGYTFDTLCEAGMTNVFKDERVEAIGNFLTSLCSTFDTSGCSNSMYVLTTNNNTYGAGVMLDVDLLDSICDKLGTDKIAILPSSRFEVLAINGMGMEDACLTNMVREVNATQLAPEEVLGNCAYFYTKGKGVEICE